MLLLRATVAVECPTHLIHLKRLSHICQARLSLGLTVSIRSSNYIQATYETFQKIPNVFQIRRSLLTASCNRTCH